MLNPTRPHPIQANRLTHLIASWYLAYPSADHIVGHALTYVTLVVDFRPHLSGLLRLSVNIAFIACRRINALAVFSVEAFSTHAFPAVIDAQYWVLYIVSVLTSPFARCVL